MKYDDSIFIGEILEKGPTYFTLKVRDNVVSSIECTCTNHDQYSHLCESEIGDSIAVHGKFNRDGLFELINFY